MTDPAEQFANPRLDGLIARELPPRLTDEEYGRLRRRWYEARQHAHDVVLLDPLPWHVRVRLAAGHLRNRALIWYVRWRYPSSQKGSSRGGQ